MKRFDEFRNRDMPLKVQDKDKEKKKKHDIGLEIFELKREMGMLGDSRQDVSIDKLLSERSKKKHL